MLGAVARDAVAAAGVAPVDPDRRRAACGCGAGGALAVPASAAEPIVVGSKRFTESYILGEIVRQTLRRAGHRGRRTSRGSATPASSRRRSTRGAIDVYPEYTGTIVREMLKRDGNPSLDELEPLARAARPEGRRSRSASTTPMRSRCARTTRSARHHAHLRPRRAARAALTLGLSHEFLARADGWPALKRPTALPQATPSGLDHGLAYDAMAPRRVDVIDIYSTDAQASARLGLRVLDDDRALLPAYDAVLLMRRERRPGAAGVGCAGAHRRERDDRDERARPSWTACSFAGGRAASALGAAGGRRGGAPARARGTHASSRALRPGLLAPARRAPAAGGRLARAAACVVGVPLGVVAVALAARGAARCSASVGVLQTIPSLALLAFLIALVGTIGIGAGAARAVPLCAAADRRATPTPASTASPRGMRQAAHVARPDARASGCACRAAARGADDPRRHQDRRGDQRRHRDDGRLRRRRRLRRAHRRRPRGQRHATMLAGALPAAVLALLVQGGVRLRRAAAVARRVDAERRTCRSRRAASVQRERPCVPALRQSADGLRTGSLLGAADSSLL